MYMVILWSIVFSVTTVSSIILLGDRNLIAGNLFSYNRIVYLLLHWKFFLAMSLAIGARISFIMINNSLLKIPFLADNSTTLTAFITSISFVFIAIGNYLFLDEKISLQHGLGAFLILIGIWVMLK